MHTWTLHLCNMSGELGCLKQIAEKADMLQSWKIQVVEMGQFACEGSGIDPFSTDFARTHALLVALGGLIKHIVVPK